MTAQKKPRKKRLSIRLDDEAKKCVTELSISEDRSMNKLVNMAVKQMYARIMVERAKDLQD